MEIVGEGENESGRENSGVCGIKSSPYICAAISAEATDTTLAAQGAAVADGGGSGGEDNDDEPGRVSRVGYVAEALELASFGGVATAVTDEGEGGSDAGIYVAATRDLSRGDLVMRCAAAGVAIDPAHRSSRCGFCACIVECEDADEKESRHLCNDCGLVSVCRQCRDAGAGMWHSTSGECIVLKALVLGLGRISGFVSNGCEGNQLQSVANQVDSFYILLVRLLYRRWCDKRADKERSSSKVSSSLPSNARRSKRARTSDDMNPAALDGSEKRAIPIDSSNQVFLPFESIFPAVDWCMFELLHSTSPFHSATPDPQIDLKKALGHLCESMRSDLRKDGVAKCNEAETQWITEDAFEDAMGKVLGCSHAITDLTLPLGNQLIGRALFFEQSFYNHCCTPNVFLSCDVGSLANVSKSFLAGASGIFLSKESKQAKVINREYTCSLFASVHCITDVKAGGPIALSYIPTSGLDRAERQGRLQDAYHFRCTCRACSALEGDEVASKWETVMKVPCGGDVGALREVQYSCNNSLLQIPRDGRSANEDNALHNCLGLIRMSANGIRNQGIPASHEVSIEKHRLMAMGLSIAGEASQALEHHKRFFGAVETVEDLFDPMALAAQKLAFSNDLVANGNLDGAKFAAVEALEMSKAVLGLEHPFPESACRLADWLRLQSRQNETMR